VVGAGHQLHLLLVLGRRSLIEPGASGGIVDDRILLTQDHAERPVDLVCVLLELIVMLENR